MAGRRSLAPRLLGALAFGLPDRRLEGRDDIRAAARVCRSAALLWVYLSAAASSTVLTPARLAISWICSGRAAAGVARVWWVGRRRRRVEIGVCRPDRVGRRASVAPRTRRPLWSSKTMMVLLVWLRPGRRTVSPRWWRCGRRNGEGCGTRRRRPMLRPAWLPGCQHCGGHGVRASGSSSASMVKLDQAVISASPATRACSAWVGRGSRSTRWGSANAIQLRVRCQAVRAMTVVLVRTAEAGVLQQQGHTDRGQGSW